MFRLTFPIILFVVFSCQNPNLPEIPEHRLNTLLHEKTWKVTSISAVRENDSTSLNWLEEQPACIQDNIFITEAPGTGKVGAIHAEEGSKICDSDGLQYHHHIASWKLNQSQNIFYVTIFDEGHLMLYGYPAGESYIDENWTIEKLTANVMHVKVKKTIEGEPYTFTIQFGRQDMSS